MENQGIDLKYVIPSRIDKDECQSLIRKAIAEKKVPPHRLTSIQEIATVYKPFWYVKGKIYTSIVGQGKNQVESTSWFHSFQANSEFLTSFISLGIRSEVLTFEPYDSESFKEKGSFLPITLDKDGAVEETHQVIQNRMILGGIDDLYKSFNLIGERYFVIYYPVIQVSYGSQKGKISFLIDGVGKSVLDVQPDNGDTDNGFSNDNTRFHVNLLTHRCKNCGHDLEVRDFDIVFYCRVCFRLWMLESNDYHSIKIRSLEIQGRKDVVFLPFWRFEVTVSSEAADLRIETIGDLSRFMKMGRHLLRNEDPKRPVALYVAAFSARNARILMRLDTRISQFQKGLPVSDTDRLAADSHMGVSLPLHEGEEMLKVLVFSVIGRIDKTAIDFYRDFDVSVSRKELVWYPVQDKGNSLFDEFHQFNIPKSGIGLAA
jgi:hypothetical protein